MATYPIRLEDAVSGVAGKIRSEIAKLRGEMRAIGEVNVGKGFNFSTWAKATAAMTAARMASEAGAAAMIRRTSAANREATAAANARANAEARVGLALMRNLHYQIRLAHYAPRPAGGGAGFGGGAGGAGGAGGIGGGEGFATDPLGRIQRALPWIAGGATAGAVGVGGFFAAKGAIGALTLAGSAAISVLGGVASAIGRAGEAAGGLAFEFGKATVAAFDFRTRATMAFQALRGAGEAGFSRMKALAIDMGTSLSGTFDGIRALSAAGFGETEAEQMFKRLQDMKGIGLDQPTLDRLVLAMSQIKGAGVLQGDELRQIQETGINVGLIWEAMAKKTGKTTAELKRMKEAGKLSADVAVEGIMSAMGKMAGGRAPGELGKEMGRKTAEGFASRLGLIKELFFDRLAGEAGPGISDLLETLSTAADDAMGWMKSVDADKVFGEMGRTIKSVAVDLQTAFKSDGARRTLLGLKDVFMSTWHVAEGLWSVTKAFATGLFGKGFDFTGTKKGLEGIAEILKSEQATSFFRGVGANVRDATQAILNAQGVMADLVHRAQSAWASVQETIAASGATLSGIGSSLGTSLVSGFTMGIWSALPSVISAATGVGAAAESGIRSALGMHSPSKVGTDLGKNYSSSISRGMVANDVGRSARTMAGDIRSATASGLGMGSSNSTTNVAGDIATNSVTSSHKTVNLTVQYMGGGSTDAASRADFEAWLVNLLERVA